jgi:NADH-quinone oxidoreductase subunit J
VLVAALIGIVLLAEVMTISRSGLATQFVVPAGFNAEQLGKYGAVGTIARPLFNEYLLAFELTSVLLLVAIAGAVVLGRRRETDAG